MGNVRIAVDRHGVARLELTRPEHGNALTAAMIADITAGAERLGRDPAVRVVVLAAAGSAFCLGADMDWRERQLRADAAERARESAQLARMLSVLGNLPRPLIGQVQGDAFGSGVGLLAVCDLAVGVTGARFGLTETRLGLIPATSAPYVVARTGLAAARRLFLSGREFSAEAAREMALLAAVVSPDDLAAAVAAETADFLAGAPGAVAEAKRLLLRLGPVVNEAMVAESIAALTARWDSAEVAEGIAAAREDRRPHWYRTPRD